MLPALLGILPAVADSTAHITITVENASSRPQYVEVVDAQCPSTRSSGCQMAEIMVNSEPCQQNANNQDCSRARTLLHSFECIDGGLFSGQLAAHQQITLQACAGRSGKAKLKTRNSKTSPWTVHSWVGKNSVVKIK
ncbi:hypothetical protein CHH28_17860 [Bacterioplanes sanyensis]|uniref:Uncharacterized protein n=2 Tax=Bacterioplanes sanyensis TaxID=1249553 RepID=A0A222FN22_9GAMM|nr:hypothetical protein CHH28_17860 [Bacterioplanes sanyensis]